MKKRIVASLLSVAMIATLAVGCAGPAKEGKTNQGGEEVKNEVSKVENETQEQNKSDMITYPIVSIPTKIWANGGSISENVVSKPAYDSLAVPTSDGYEYYLADTIELKDDNLTYSIHIRDNANWSDGTPITSGDMKFTKDYYENILGYDYGEFNEIDDKTFELKVGEKPRASFIANFLAYFTPLPSKPFENDYTKVDDSDYFAKPEMITSGPYTVSEINEDHIIFKARDDYYAGKPSVETVVAKVIPTEEAQQVAFENGELSFYKVTVNDVLETYKNNDKYTIYEMDDAVLNYIQIKKKLPDDAREAICLALDNKEIIDVVFGSETFASPANSYMTPAHTSYNADTRYSVNLDRAKKLAKDSGLEGQTLTFIYNIDRQGAEGVATVAQQQLAKIGVTLKLEGLESGTFFERMWPQAYGIENPEPWDLGYNQQEAMAGTGNVFLVDYTTPGSMWGEWGFSKKVVDMVAQAEAAPSIEESDKLYYNVQPLINAEHLGYPVAYTKQVIVSQSNVKGIDAVAPYSGPGDFSKLIIE